MRSPTVTSPPSTRTSPPPGATSRAAARTLVVGWFSVGDGRSATAGDLEAHDVVCHWLKRARRPFDVALGHRFAGGVDWRDVDPADYACVIHVCGPVAPESDVAAILSRFPDACRIGVNVSMVRPLGEWNIFDELIERDSAQVARADLAFAVDEDRVPVVGVILEGPHPDERGDHVRADAAIEDLLERRGAARLPIDTRLAENVLGLRNAAEVEGVIARMDLVVTTRVDGLVLAIKQGVPVLGVDPVAGGGEVLSQADVLGWPAALGIDALAERPLDWLWEWCRRPEARGVAAASAQRAATAAVAVRAELLNALKRGLAGARGRSGPA